MPARVIEICDGLKNYVEGQTYSYTFSVKRENPAHHRLESSPFTTLFVYPAPQGPSTATRNKWLHTYGITIHMVNFVDSVSQSEIDDVYEAMEEITDSLKDAVISGRSLMEFSTEDNPEELVLEEALITANLAQSATRCIYQELR